MSENVKNFKAELMKKMYRLQDEINRLHVSPYLNRDKIYEKEKEIAELFVKLRGVRDTEQKSK